MLAVDFAWFMIYLGMFTGAFTLGLVLWGLFNNQ